MAFWNKWKMARDVATKSWVQPEIWSLQHPLNWYNTGSPFGENAERIENDFVSYVEGAYKRNGPIFSCMVARQMVFSEPRLVLQSMEGGVEGDLEELPPRLKILEKPWQNGTTGELFARAIQDADLAGNAYFTFADDGGNYGRAARGGPNARIVRMRPDWVTMIVGTLREGGNPNDLDAKVLMFRYRGPQMDHHIDLAADEVAHFSPHPDPTARFRGMSWMTPVLRDIEADLGAGNHKKKFYDNAAVPNLAVKFDKETEEDEFQEFVKSFKAEHQGHMNAYKTLFLMGGADVTPLTMDFKALDFNAVVGKGESRIASAAGVPPSWVGFSEGMQGSALNAGNFTAARRRFADGTIRPLWRIFCASMENLVEVPAGKRLWVDVTGVAFLREDAKDRAEIFAKEMVAIDQGIKSGFEADACVEAASTKDVKKLLGKHTGLVSVQMQPPMTEDDNGELRLMQEESTILAQLAPHFEPESIVDALDSRDWAKLKKKKIEPIPGAPGAPGGAPKPGGTPAPAKPKPAAKPANGGGSGQQGSQQR